MKNNRDFIEFNSTDEIEKQFNIKCVQKYKVGDIMYCLKEDNTQIKCPIIELKIVTINFDEEECFIYYDCEENIDEKMILNVWDYDEDCEFYNDREEAVKATIANLKNRINEIEAEKENIEKIINLCLGDKK